MATAAKEQVWEFLKETGRFHSTKELMEKFGVKDPRTIKSWLNTPFILKSNSSKRNVYKFIADNEELYLQALGHSATPGVDLPVGPKNVSVPREFIDGEPQFAVLLPTTGKQLHGYSLKQLEALAQMDEPKLEWIKTAIIGLYDMRFIKGADNNMKALVAVMTDILMRNTYEDTKEAVDKLRASMAPAEESIEEIREMELADIMKHVPAGTDDKGFDINDPSSWN